MPNPDYSIETSTVISVEGKWAMVITNKSKACRECGKAQAGACGKGGAGMALKVRNPLGAKKGDIVMLGIEEKTRVKGYFFIFIMPVIVLFLSAFLGYLLSRYSSIKNLEAFFGFLGLVISIIYASKKTQELNRTSHLYITKILQGQELQNYNSGIDSEAMDYLTAFNNLNQKSTH
ncbi:MAG: SoxR reducing system RseC family protein [Nitrospirae bacterium]|nr:SoxR reducing system RseC family protein [Nitrospirota bacterium]